MLNNSQRIDDLRIPPQKRMEKLSGDREGQYRLAKEIAVPEPRISAICNGKRAITADTAVRLSRFFGTTVVSGSGFRPL